jgi:hypothetical protein
MHFLRRCEGQGSVRQPVIRLKAGKYIGEVTWRPLPT